MALDYNFPATKIFFKNRHISLGYHNMIFPHVALARNLVVYEINKSTQTHRHTDTQVDYYNPPPTLKLIIYLLWLLKEAIQ